MLFPCGQYVYYTIRYVIEATAFTEYTLLTMAMAATQDPLLSTFYCAVNVKCRLVESTMFICQNLKPWIPLLDLLTSG